MPPYADLYVLTPSRTEATIVAFLKRFAPVREETAVDYCIPQGADPPQTFFQTAAEAIAYCCSHPAEPQSIYWRRVGEGDPAFAMVFFTTDGFLILGLSTTEDMAEQYFAKLRAHAGSEIGYITWESPPPDTANEFRKLVKHGAMGPTVMRALLFGTLASPLFVGLLFVFVGVDQFLAGGDQGDRRGPQLNRISLKHAQEQMDSGIVEGVALSSYQL